MDEKKIKEVCYYLDEKSKQSTGYVVYEDGSHELLNNFEDLKRITKEVILQYPSDQFENVLQRYKSSQIVSDKYQEFIDKLKKNRQSKNARGEKVSDRNHFSKAAVAGVGAAAGLVGAAVGTTATYQALQPQIKNVATTKAAAENADESELTSAAALTSAQATQETATSLENDLKLTAFQSDFLENAETTISQYNELCDKYGLSDDYKINIKEYLAAYISYNDLSDEQASELVPILLEEIAENGEFTKVGKKIDTNTMNSWLQSLHVKWGGMSAVISDVNDVDVFDGFIQKVGINAKSEDEVNSLVEASENKKDGTYTEEYREKELANLNHAREIFHQVWVNIAEANSNQQTLDAQHCKDIISALRNADGTLQQSAINNLIGDTYAITAYKIEGADETIIEYTHENSSFNLSTQSNKNNQSISDVVISADSKVEGSVATRLANAIKMANEKYAQTYAKIENEGQIKYKDYVHSEYNERFNEMLKEYDFELWNEGDTASKNLNYKDLVNKNSYRYNSMLDTSNNGQYVGGTRTTTSAPETWTETVPGEGDLLSSTEAEQRAAAQKVMDAQGLKTPDGDPDDQEEIEQTVNDYVDQGFTYHDNNNNGIVDGGDELKKQEVGDPGASKITTPYDGVANVGKIDGTTEQITDENYKSDPTNNPLTDHMHDSMKENDYNEGNRLPESQTSSQPVEENPTVGETTSQPEEQTPAADSNTSGNDSATTDTNTDSNNVEVSVGDFVPFDIGEVDENVVENSQVFDSNGNFANGIVMASSEPVEKAGTAEQAAAEQAAAEQAAAEQAAAEQAAAEQAAAAQAAAEQAAAEQAAAEQAAAEQAAAEQAAAEQAAAEQAAAEQAAAEQAAAQPSIEEQAETIINGLVNQPEEESYNLTK